MKWKRQHISLGVWPQGTVGGTPLKRHLLKKAYHVAHKHVICGTLGWKMSPRGAIRPTPVFSESLLSPPVLIFLTPGISRSLSSSSRPGCADRESVHIFTVSNSAWLLFSSKHSFCLCKCWILKIRCNVRFMVRSYCPTRAKSLCSIAQLMMEQNKKFSFFWWNVLIGAWCSEYVILSPKRLRGCSFLFGWQQIFQKKTTEHSAKR